MRTFSVTVASGIYVTVMVSLGKKERSGCHGCLSGKVSASVISVSAAATVLKQGA